jgi:hypothetical protein
MMRLGFRYVCTSTGAFIDKEFVHGVRRQCYMSLISVVVTILVHIMLLFLS